MKEKLSKLLSVRSLVTLLVTLCFAFLSVRGDIKPDLFIPIYTTIIAFFFGTKNGGTNE